MLQSKADRGNIAGSIAVAGFSILMFVIGTSAIAHFYYCRGYALWFGARHITDSPGSPTSRPGRR
jgi:hypothetical protein